MSRIPNLMKASLALLAFVTLGMLAVLVFGSQAGPWTTPGTPGARTPVAQVTPTPPPYPPPGSPTPPGPPATPTSVPVPIPPCAFAAAPAPAGSGPALDAYVFSEPRVVLTHTSAIGIAGWLPDGERLLITRETPGKPRQIIETFNIRTGETRRYAERHSLSSRPIWLADQQAVAFVDATIAEGRAWWSLCLSRGEKQPVEILHTHLAFPYLAADPTGRQVSVLSSDRGIRPIITDVAGKTMRALSIQLPEAATTYEQAYHMVWSPRGKWLACYSAVGFYLIEVATGQVCEVDLGGQQYAPGKRWALDAQWSPDERYLAVLTTAGRSAVKFSDLTVLDTNTGELRLVYPEENINSGLHYITEMSWAPNSRIMAIWSVVERREGTDWAGLFLVDVTTGKSRRVLPELLFGGADWGQNLAWSPHGQILIVACPGNVEPSLCVFTITER